MCKISWYLEDRDFKAFREVLRVLTKFWDIRTGILYPSWSVCKILLDLEDRDFKAFREVLRV